jgi:hypothetical protein
MIQSYIDNPVRGVIGQAYQPVTVWDNPPSGIQIHMNFTVFPRDYEGWHQDEGNHPQRIFVAGQ